MVSSIVILDVGGQLFRSTKSTLTSVDSYFSRLLSDTWMEGTTMNEEEETSSSEMPLTSAASATRTAPAATISPEKTQASTNSASNKVVASAIFIDRDPTCFSVILSYLRSHKVHFSDTWSDAFLDQIMDESEYFMLHDLTFLVKEEQERRQLVLETQALNEEKDQAADTTDIYKVIDPEHVQDFFNRGYAYVDSYEGFETAACHSNMSNTKIPTSFEDGRCVACSTSMSYEKFVRHVSSIRPIHVVVKRSKSVQRSFNMSGVNGIMNTPTPTHRRMHSVSSNAANSINMLNSPQATGHNNNYPTLTPGNFNLDTSF